MSYSKDSTVDYKVDNDIPPEESVQLLFWHKALYVLLTIIILASLVVITIQLNGNAILRAENDTLRAENGILKATIEVLKATPTP